MSALDRPIALIGAPSSIGIRPFDDSGAIRIYDTGLDPDGSSAATLATLLERVLVGRSE